MKTRTIGWFLIAVMLLFATTGCVKSIASDDDITIDYQYHNQVTGATAKDILSDEAYTSITIEVQHMKGITPDSAALENLKAFLYENTHKPKGIDIVMKEIPSFTANSITLNEAAEMEKRNRKIFSKKKDLALYVFYTDGYFADPDYLGWAYRNTSMVLFGRKLLESSESTGKPSRTKLETTVLLHEMAHLLGLVNVGTPLQSAHKDDDHGKHCANPNCLMYYQIGINESLSILLKKGIPKLDAACLADLRANGGR